MLKSALFIAIMALGCGKSLPIEIYIDETFSPMDRKLLFEAIDEWNLEAKQRLYDEKPIFVVAGEIETLSSVDDLADKIKGIYNADYKIFTPPHRKTGDAYGYTTVNDCLIYVSNMRSDYDWTILPDDENNLDRMEKIKWIKKMANYAVKKVMFHELGHLLELSHYFNRPGVMNVGMPPNPDLDNGPHLSLADLDAFCTIYKCK